MSALSRNLKVVLEAYDLSPMDMARRVEVSPSMISLILRDKTNPAANTVEKLASYFSLEGWWLSSPYFNINIPQENINRLMDQVRQMPSAEFIDAVTDFAAFKNAP